jgi:hypothetical protein
MLPALCYIKVLCWNPSVVSFTWLFYLCSVKKHANIRTWWNIKFYFIFCANINVIWGLSWSLYGCWISNYLSVCNQCLSPLMLWVQTLLKQGVLHTPLCDKVWQWFSPGTLVSSTNKTDHHDITEMLLKVELTP